MLLTPAEFHYLSKQSETWSGFVGIDFETTGLNPYAGDKAKILGLTNPQGEKFCVYTTPETYESVARFVSNPKLIYCSHNSKFESSFLREQFGAEIQGKIYDTDTMARIQDNNCLSYSLQSCAGRVGLTKTPAMLEWLKIRGNKGRHVHAEPKLLEEYVMHDAWLSWELRRLQIETFKLWDSGPIRISPVVNLESRVIPPLFDMESRGLLVDVDYCKRAIEYENYKLEEAKDEFELLAGVPLVDSRKTLVPVFDRHGIRYGKTALGNASLTEENLALDKDHAIVRALLKHRQGLKRVTTYWEKYLELHIAGVIHPNINQNRAKTGRMSISNPSFQNVPTDEDDPEFPIRRAFVARPGCVIASLDYAAMELRVMCDEADDKEMINAIQTGKDFHQAVADAAGVPRSLAKNGRFAKLYGAGIPRVAATLGISEALARTISDEIDRSSLGVTRYVRGLIRHAEKTGWGNDFLGRRFHFDRGFAYTFPNYRIQGACAEILKLAIINVDAFLKEHARPETYLVLVVHDELVINMHKDDLHLLPQVKQLMIAAHTHKRTLAMDVSVNVGPNFHDLVEYKG